MDPALKPSATALSAHWRPRGRLWLARLQWAVGWMGIAGLLLLAVALVAALVQQRAWRTSISADHADGAGSQQARPAPPVDLPSGQTTSAPSWPRAASAPMLLDRMARIAAAQGIGWPHADYRYVNATADLPASIEVQCGFKGGYPAIRKFVTAILREWPSATLRELQLQRAGTELAEIEARMTIVVFVDGESPDAVAVPKVPR